MHPLIASLLVQLNLNNVRDVAATIKLRGLVAATTTP